jgi:hypothetical protein
MKRTISIHVFFLALFSFSALHLAAQEERKNRDKNAINTRKKTPEKIIEHIVGTWEVEGIYKGNKDISNTDTVGVNSTIIFDREAKYISYSGNEQIDSGRYRLNENHSILYLESAAGQEPSEWKVSFNNNGMTLQPKETYPHAESFRYLYTRKSNEGKLEVGDR